MPSSVFAMIASSENSTIDATRASASSARPRSATTAARSSVIIAIVPMKACNSSSDSFCVSQTKGPAPRNVPQVAITERRTTHVAASRGPNRNAARMSSGTHRNSSG